MLALVLEHQGYRPLSDLRRVPPTSRHDLILSGDLVSIEAGAVQIANTFGSWAKAREVAGEASLADVLARRLTENGRALTRDDVLAGVRLYADTGRPLTLSSYVKWARAEMQQEDRKLDRMARSPRSINRLFGSWGELLIEAGLGERLAGERSAGQKPSGRADDYTVDRVKDWITTAARECGGGQMTKERYDEWASRHAHEALASGRRLIIPRSKSALRHFESWPFALAAAGLITEEEAIERRGKRGSYMTDAFLAESLAAAMVEIGPTPSQARYQEWRRLRGISGDSSLGAIPRVDTIANRYGGWANALEAAMRTLEPGDHPAGNQLLQAGRKGRRG